MKLSWHSGSDQFLHLTADSLRSFRMGGIDFDDPLLTHISWTALMRFFQNGNRFAVQLGHTHAQAALQRLRAAQGALSIRDAARILGCSKSTVRKYVNLKLLKWRDLRANAKARRRLRIDRESLEALIVVCAHHRNDIYNSRDRQFSVIRERVRASGPLNFQLLPRELTVRETAEVLGCSRSSVLRLIHDGVIGAKRKTPCRWRVKRESLRSF